MHSGLLSLLFMPKERCYDLRILEERQDLKIWEIRKYLSDSLKSRNYPNRKFYNPNTEQHL